MAFYNTIGESGKELNSSRKQTIKQEDIVLGVFRANRKPMTASEIHDLAFKDNTPLTSTRRAITDLTTRGVLEKTNIQKVGAYQKLNYCYKLVVVEAPVQMELF